MHTLDNFFVNVEKINLLKKSTFALTSPHRLFPISSARIAGSNLTVSFRV